MTLIEIQMHLMGRFTVVCSVTEPMNGCEAAGDLVLIQTSILIISLH